MRTEIFYGIRVGDPRRDKTYLMLGNNDRVILCDKKAEAEADKEYLRYKGPNLKVVKVKVTYAG